MKKNMNSYDGSSMLIPNHKHAQRHPGLVEHIDSSIDIEPSRNEEPLSSARLGQYRLKL